MSIPFPQLLLAIVTLVVPIVIARYRYLSIWWVIAIASAILATGIVTLDPVSHADDWYYMAVFPVFLGTWASLADGGFQSRSRNALGSDCPGDLIVGVANRKSFAEALEILVGCALNVWEVEERRRRTPILYSQELQWQVADRARDLEVSPVAAAVIFILLASERVVHRAGFWAWLGSSYVRTLRRNHAAMLNIENVLTSVYASDAISGYVKGQSKLAIDRYAGAIKSILDAAPVAQKEPVAW